MLDKKVSGNADRIAALTAALLLLLPVIALCIEQGEHDTQPKYSKLIVTVTAEQDNSPVAGARVIITGPNDTDRSAKTRHNGKVTISKLPRKRLTVQVVATGFETRGKRVTLSLKVEKMSITLKKSITPPDLSDENQQMD